MILGGKRADDALQVPLQAVFGKNGKNHVFVKIGERFEQREVKVTHRTESRVVPRRAGRGTEIALVDPIAARDRPRASRTPQPLPASRPDR